MTTCEASCAVGMGETTPLPSLIVWELFGGVCCWCCFLQSMNMASRTRHTSTYVTSLAGDDDDGDAYQGPEPMYDPKQAVSRLSLEERNRMASMRRRTPQDDDDETETHPLSSHAKAALMGAVMQPLRSREHGTGTEGLCCSVNAAGDTAVVGCQNSQLLVVNPHTMELMQTIDLSQHGNPSSPKLAAGRPATNPYGVPAVSACTAVRYISSTVGSQTAAVVLVAKGSSLLHVHVSTAKVLSTVDEGPNKVNNLVMSPDGRQFATTGSDGAVRLYDQNTSRQYVKLDHGDGETTTGHSNDVFGLAWQAEDPNVLVSAGWDHTIQVWDVRLRRSVRSIYGPYVCGDALDVQKGVILAGSWRHSRPLELWDLGTCKLRTRLPFQQPEQDACKLYSAGFGRGAMAGYIFAGGSGKRPCVKVFTSAGELVSTTHVHSAVNSIHAVGLPKDRFLTVSCSKELLIMDIKP